MEPRRLSPQEASTLLTRDSEARYVDVRTVAEFSAGHPSGSVVNVPIEFVHPTTGEHFPNESFLLVIEEIFSKDATLIAGADDGERATRAARQLREAGYEKVSVMAEGYESWREHKLPTTRDNRDGISYVSLLTRVKRPRRK